MARVRIEYEAMEILRASVYEIPRREISGVLIGTRVSYEDDFVFTVQNAMPLQKAKRTIFSVRPSTKGFRRVRNITPFIGGYHSHVSSITDGAFDSAPLKFSKGDRSYVRAYYPEGIEILIALNPIERTFKYILEQKMLCACFSDKRRDKNYSFEMSAYYLNGKRTLRADLDIDKSTLKALFTC